MNVLKKLTGLALMLTLFTTACQKDKIADFDPTPAKGQVSLQSIEQLNGAWVLTAQQANWQGGYYAFPAANQLPNPLTWNPSNSTTSTYAAGGRSKLGYFWTLGDFNTTRTARGIQRFSAAGTSPLVPKFKAIGPSDVQVFDQTDEINYFIHDASVAYYTDVALEPRKITLFNPTSAELTDIGTWDLTTALAGNALLTADGYNGAAIRNLGGRLLIRRGDVIYADVTFGNTYTALQQVDQLTNKVYVAAINTTTGALITVSAFNGARNIGLFNDHPLANVDPVSQHIYFATVSNMADQLTPSRILRIDNGSNSINTSFNRNYQDFGFKSEFNTLYAYDDYLYVKYATRDAIYSHSSGYRDPIWQWSVINPAGVKKRLDIPNDDFYAYQQPRLINGEIYFIYNNSSVGTAGIHKTLPVNAASWAAEILPTTTVSNYTASGNIVRIVGVDKLR